MTTKEILEKLQSLGTEQTRKTLKRHGAKDPVFGVKIEDMKKLLKGIKGNNRLAMELFNTGNYDAMYFAGLIADGSKLTADEIRGWAGVAYGSGISEYTVPWVATENSSAPDLAKEWIESDVEQIAVSGWSTLACVVSVWPDENLDLPYLRSMLHRVETEIHQAPNRVRYTMNGFVIAVGAYVAPLHEECLAIAGSIGTVKVEMHGTACKVPVATDYILKISKMGRTGQKRKVVKC